MMMFDDTLISIHAPTRGATILCNHRGLVFGFQSTLPREERRDNMKVIAEIEKFQSTLPREERLSSQARLIWWHQHFNPRSHERSDNQKGKRMAREKISIHAPTRGATQHDRMAGHRRNHFNPRSHERSDDKNHSGAVDNAEFQSTLPREERL